MIKLFCMYPSKPYRYILYLDSVKDDQSIRILRCFAHTLQKSELYLVRFQRDIHLVCVVVVIILGPSLIELTGPLVALKSCFLKRRDFSKESSSALLCGRRSYL